ncbi:fungal specific transcription factor factor [Fusarium mexicanum]|uniref:Fungal specific transcription factor factor n=1 Tax=Fusarium mexicanum TaxID=751941 RepID=A0A8H5IHI1_9HYPO|nr:fungal specific transcription factor factor [Fusarium mexicanum]
MSRTPSSNTSTPPQAVQERGSLRTLEAGKSQFIGSSSGIYFVNTVRRAFINANSRLSSRLLDTTHPTPEECIVADGEDEQQRPDTDASLLPSSFRYGPGIPSGLGRPPQLDVAKQLFMVYFQTWHRFFPFLHGPTVLKNMEDLYSSFDQHGTASEPIAPRVPITLTNVIILQCVFNLASLHSSSQLPVASEIHKPTDVLPYLPGLAVKGDLVSIQALFAAGLLLVARMSLRAAAVVSGLLSRAVFLAGLHRCPCRYGKLTADECDIRKRLFWCIYVFDRYLSQALGHPLGIQDSDVDVCPLSGPELHHPLLHPTVPSSHIGVPLSFSGLSASLSSSLCGDAITARQSETALGTATSEGESSQKHNRHSSLSFQVQYSRLLGRALELFHKSLHIRSIDSGSILSLQTDINALWNALPSSLQEFDPSSCDTTNRNQIQVFNESAHFILLHSQLVLLIHRPRLSLEPSTPAFQSAIQICISEARQIIKIISKQHNAGYALFWPGYLSVTWMAGIVLAFACQLRLYSADKGKR